MQFVAKHVKTENREEFLYWINGANHQLKPALEGSIFSHKRNINLIKCSKTLLHKHNSSNLSGKKREIWQIKPFTAKYIKTRMYKEHPFVYSGFYSLCLEEKQLLFPTLLQKLALALDRYFCACICARSCIQITQRLIKGFSIACVPVLVSPGFSGMCRAFETSERHTWVCVCA